MPMSELHWTAQSGYPVLAVLQLLPLAAAAVILACRSDRTAFRLGLAAAALELLVAADLYRHFDPSRTAMQLAEHVRIVPPVAYHAAVDGISVLFILLTAALTVLAVLYGRVRPLDPQSRFVGVALAVEAALMGQFVTVDLLWFVALSAVQLILAGYLLWRWATSPDKDMAFQRFLQFMATGILLLAMGTFMLGWNHADANGGRWTFDLHALAQVPVADHAQSVIFFLLFYGFAIRIPLFPMHGWLPLSAEHGSVAAAPAFLLGLKTGIYGLLRFVFPLVPEAVTYWQPYVVAFAVVGIFYAALLAMQQVNMRRLLAFAVVSHTSIAIIGLFSLNHRAFQGGILLSAGFGLAAAGMLFMSGLIYRRTRTLSLRKIGGLFDRIPFVGITFLVAGLSIVGMPGTPGYDAAHLVLEAAMERFGALVTIAAALGNVVAAGFLLWAFQRVFLGPRPEGGAVAAGIDGTAPLELLIGTMLIVILLGTGFYSEPWIQLIDGALSGLDDLYGGGYHR